VLVKGYSPKTVSYNIATERRAGRPLAQSIAIAMREKRDAEERKRKR